MRDSNSICLDDQKTPQNSLGSTRTFNISEVVWPDGIRVHRKNKSSCLEVNIYMRYKLVECFRQFVMKQCALDCVLII